VPFTGGPATVNVMARIYGDTDVEATEYFRIVLGVLNDNGLAPFVGLDDAFGLGTITNDD